MDLPCPHRPFTRRHRQPDWPETLARLAARVDAEDARARARYQAGPEPERWPRLAAMTAEATDRARAILADPRPSLSTRPATRPGPLPSAAPQDAPARPSKR